MRFKAIGATTALVAFAFMITHTAQGQTPLTTARIATGLSRPTWLGSPPGDHHRLFVGEQMGRIRIIEDGVLLATSFLDITALVQGPNGSEQGLLGVAFHPDYETNGFFFVSYTKKSPNQGASMLVRYTVSSTDPNVADPNSATVFLGPISQPFTNHNGGNIVFRGDWLFFGLGDGGSGGDPNCNAQNLLTPLGKLLRMDVDGNPNGPALPAPGNPFAGGDPADDLVWSFGLRNPWRWSFDRLTGDLWIADVGQDAREEINFVAASSPGAENYGWKMMEGLNCFSTSACPPTIPACNDPVLVDPVRQYGHGVGSSVTGGYVYRGCGIPDLQGTYFYGDYTSSRFWSFELVGGVVTNVIERTSDLQPPVGSGQGSVARPSSFGEDADGEMYILDHLGGEVFKIVPEVPSASTDLGFGKVGGNGLVPHFRACGVLSTTSTADFILVDAPANRFALLLISQTQNPIFTMGSVVVPDITGPFAAIGVTTDANGEIRFTGNGGGGPITAYAQYLIDDPGATFNAGISNAIQVNVLP